MKIERFAPELIAPCGMNCGTCIAFFGYTLEGGKRKHSCSSCRSRKSQCAFLKKKCEKLATKRIDYCNQCTDFPCGNLKLLDKRYTTNYGMSMIENLRYIQTNGVQQFLEHDRERWKCATCGGMICVHNKTCYTCN